MPSTTSGNEAATRYGVPGGTFLRSRFDEYAVVRAMSESFYTLVRVMEALPRVGVRVLDLWADQEYLLIDMGFSRTARRGLVLATRILPFGEFVTTSGAALPVDGPTLQQIQDSVLPNTKLHRRASVRWPTAGGKPPNSRPPSSACAGRAGPRIGLNTHPSPQSRRPHAGAKDGGATEILLGGAAGRDGGKAFEGDAV